MKPFDYLIVGSGLFGAVFAHQAKQKGKKCLVIDRRKHSGGNVHCENVDGIQVHQYGAHIFHTNNQDIWDFVNAIVPFNNYINSPKAYYKGKLYSLPLNMNTFEQLWGVKEAGSAKYIIQKQVEESGVKVATNLEEQAILMVGTEVFEKLIKGYTEKQWGRSCKDLPASIIKRLPVRFTFDNNYFNDRFQGIPQGGYNKLIDGLLDGVEVRLNIDYFSEKEYLDGLAEKLVFTGKIDEYYNYRFGALEYRSLHFEHERMSVANFQGNAVVNYTERDVPYTRIIEHKHFEFGKQEHTVVTREYPLTWKPGLEPYYPINDERNTSLFKQYEALAKEEQQVIFGGRLAEYRYYDMHQVIGSALASARRHLGDGVSRPK